MLTIEGLIAVMSLTLTAFSLGYSLGLHSKSTNRHGQRD